MREFLEGPYPHAFRCPFCDRHDRVGEGMAAAFSVVPTPGGYVTFLHHVDCAASQVFSADQNLVGLRERGLCVVRPGPTPQALFVCVSEARLVHFHSTAESVSIEIARALSEGFELVLSSATEIVPAFVPGWYLDISLRRRRLMVTSKTPGVGPYIGELPPGSGRWTRTVREQKECIVLLGSGLHLTAESMLEQLELLTESGRLVAGILRARWLDETHPS